MSVGDIVVPASNPVITVENLTKRYGDEVAVDDVSFTVARGAIYGFLGTD